MQDFVALPSRWRLALMALGAAAFVAIGLWMAGMFGAAPRTDRYSADATNAIGWICVAFFALCGVAIVRRLFDTRAQVRIGPHGILWVRLSDRTIPWSDITDITEWSHRGQRMIILHLRDPARWPPRGVSALLAGANRALTGGDVAISLTGTDRSFDEAVAAIGRFRR